jgi:hypothetical protein
MIIVSPFSIIVYNSLYCHSKLGKGGKKTKRGEGKKKKKPYSYSRHYSLMIKTIIMHLLMVAVFERDL